MSIDSAALQGYSFLYFSPFCNSTAPNQKLIDINGKATGTFAQERGLTYAIVPDAGHMIDSDAPATALAALKTLLGERKLSG